MVSNLSISSSHRAWLGCEVTRGFFGKERLSFPIGKGCSAQGEQTRGARSSLGKVVASS